MLLDPETGFPQVLVSASYLNGYRTAAARTSDSVIEFLCRRLVAVAGPTRRGAQYRRTGRCLRRDLCDSLSSSQQGDIMKFTIRIAGLLAAVLLAGCDADDNNPATAESSRPVAYPSVDASFLLRTGQSSSNVSTNETGTALLILGKLAISRKASMPLTRSTLAALTMTGLRLDTMSL